MKSLFNMLVSEIWKQAHWGESLSRVSASNSEFSGENKMKLLAQMGFVTTLAALIAKFFLPSFDPINWIIGIGIAAMVLSGILETLDYEPPDDRDLR